MAEYIERKKIFPNGVFFANENDPLASLDELIKRIWSIPAADVAPVVHGRNLNDTPSLFECSVCHWECWDTVPGDTSTYNYCPNCGARMDGE